MINYFLKEDNTKEALNHFKEQLVIGMKSIGLTAEGYAIDDCPVDTGRLRDSISNAIVEEEKAIYIGTNVEYAPYVEYNDNAHHEVGKAHFLRDAATTHSDEYKAIMEAALKAN